MLSAAQLEAALADHRLPVGDAARSALRAGDATSSLAELDRLDQRAGELSHLRGLAHLIRGDLYRAADAFTAALDLEPDRFDARVRLGRIQLLREEYGAAAATLTHALDQRPDHPETIAALSAAHAARGHADEAEALARRGLVFDPDSAVLLNALADSLRRQSRHAEAVPVLYRALARADERSTRVALGRSLLALHRPLEARPLFEDVLRRDTDDVGALAGMAEALEMEGRLADALGYILRAVAAAPERAGLHVLHARLALRNGRLETAEDAATTASTLDPRRLEARRIALRAAVAQRRLRRAEAYGRALVEQAPGDAEALAAIAVVHAFDGEVEAARALMDTATSVNASADAQRALGCIELAGRRADIAAQHLTEALRLRGDDLLAQRLLELAWEVAAEPELDGAARMRAVLIGEGEVDDEPSDSEDGASTSRRKRAVTGPIAPLVLSAVNRLLADEEPGQAPAPEMASFPVPSADLLAHPYREEPTTAPQRAIIESVPPADDPEHQTRSGHPTEPDLNLGTVDVPDGVLTRLHRLRHLLRVEHTLSDLLVRVGELIEGHDSPLLLAVAGPPGSGKTAFVNALIGEAVIPEDARLPHLVRYGRRSGGRVIFRDGRVEAFGLAALRTALGEQRLSPEDVRWVEILLPVEELVRARILDAPHPMTSAADDPLQRTADAVLWLVGADQPRGLWQDAATWLADQPMAAIAVITRSDGRPHQTIESTARAVRASLGDRVSGVVAVSARDGLTALRSRSVDALRSSGFVALHRLLRDAFFSRAAIIRTTVTRARLAEVVTEARARVRDQLARIDQQMEAADALARRVHSDARSFAGGEETRATRTLNAALGEALRGAATETAALYRDHGGAFTSTQLVDTLREVTTRSLADAVDGVRQETGRRLSALIEGYFAAFDQIFGASGTPAEQARVAGLRGILDGHRRLRLEEVFGRYRAFLDGWMAQAPLGVLFAEERALCPTLSAGGAIDPNRLAQDLRTHGVQVDSIPPPRLDGLGQPLFEGIGEFISDATTELRLSRIALVKRLEEPLARLGQGLTR